MKKQISTLWGVIIILIVAVVLFGGAFAYQYFIKTPTQQTQTAISQTVDWKNYKNIEYGFEITFPDSWKGYTVEKSVWNGQDVNGEGKKYSGVEIIIKNPQTTADQVWQDIPVMVFTPDVWQLVESEDVGVSAAPIPPAKIGENSKYVFATPPRWYGFTDAQGWQEAVDIVKTFKAF